MSGIEKNVERIIGNVANTYATLAGLGAEVPEGANSDELAETAAKVKAVLYGGKQELSNAEKEQARGNIGAASAEDVTRLSKEKADKEFVINIFEQLKVLIETGKTDEAIAVLDEAILDLAILA